MDEFASRIEALEHRWMRAWAGGHRDELKTLTSRDFIFLHGGTRPAILDRASWLEAAGSRMRCDAYRFGSVYVRRHGTLAVFCAPVELDAKFDRTSFKGSAFVTDLWKRTKIKRRWQLIERVLTRAEGTEELAIATRSMQLWR